MIGIINLSRPYTLRREMPNYLNTTVRYHYFQSDLSCTINGIERPPRVALHY